MSDSTKTSLSNSSAEVLPCQYNVALHISLTYVWVRSLLLILIYIPVIYHGYQKWKQRRSFTTTSHADIFVYHKLVFDFIYAVGCLLLFCGMYLKVSTLQFVGAYLASFDIPSQTLLHNLTCIERYLAVVHPVIYRGLKQSGGSKVRNIGLGCIWLQTFGWMGLTKYYSPEPATIPYFVTLAISFILTTFCSVRVFCILIRPRLADSPGRRVKVDQSKQKAFNTIAIITAITYLSFTGLTLGTAAEYTKVLGQTEGCYVLVAALWTNLPCNLLLPILFIQRSGKVFFCK